MVSAAVLFFFFVVRFSLAERKTNNRYSGKYLAAVRPELGALWAKGKQSSTLRGDRVTRMIDK
jgi:hypothetical protein